MKDIRQELCDLSGDDDLLFADGFDDCIIGVALAGPGMEQRVVYDAEACVQELMNSGIDDIDDADEFFSINTLGSYVGPRTPIYITRYEPRTTTQEGEA